MRPGYWNSDLNGEGFSHHLSIKPSLWFSRANEEGPDSRGSITSLSLVACLKPNKLLMRPTFFLN